MPGSGGNEAQAPALLIANLIAELGGWRGEMLTRLRALIHAAAPNIKEDWKWGTPVWSQKGNVVSAAAFKDHIKLNFFKGAALDDPLGLFNAGLDAKTARSIDFKQCDDLPEEALKQLIRGAATLDRSQGGK